MCHTGNLKGILDSDNQNRYLSCIWVIDGLDGFVFEKLILVLYLGY